MSKLRVHELAKELGISSKEAVAKLQELGEFVKSASSTIEAPAARKLREAIPAKPAAAAEEKPVKKAAKKAKKKKKKETSACAGQDRGSEPREFRGEPRGPGCVSRMTPKRHADIRAAKPS